MHRGKVVSLVKCEEEMPEPQRARGKRETRKRSSSGDPARRAPFDGSSCSINKSIFPPIRRLSRIDLPFFVHLQRVRSATAILCHAFQISGDFPVKRATDTRGLVSREQTDDFRERRQILFTTDENLLLPVGYKLSSPPLFARIKRRKRGATGISSALLPEIAPPLSPP